MHTLEQTILETTTAWEQEGIAHGEIRPIIGAVDETFLQRMMLVFMELASGYLLMEEVAVDRTYDTWDGLVKARLKTLEVGVLYLVSDRAKALIKLAQTGLDCRHWFSLMGTCLPFEIITMPFESGKFPAQIAAFLVGLKRLRELLGW